MKTKAELRRVAANEVPIADYLPFGAHVAPNVVKLRANGDYVATWKLDGIAFETADFDDLNQRKEALNNFLHTLSGGKFALWSHKLRRKVSDRLDGQFTNPFCQRLNDRYFDGFKNYRMMSTELYLTLVYRPTPSRVAGFFKRMAARTADQIAAQTRIDLDALDDAAKQVEASLSKYGPERLTAYDRNGVACSAMARFFGFLANGAWEDVPMRAASVSEYLPAARLHFGDTNGMLQIDQPGSRKFVGFLDFQEYPATSQTGMNNAILYGDYEYIETQSFSILNKREALERLDRQMKQLSASEESSETEAREIEIAKDQVQRGTIDMGEYHYTLAIFGDTLDAVAKHMADAKSSYDGPGFKMAVCDAIPEAAWFAQQPGNWWLRPREATITSYNFACLSPFHNFASGKRSGNPWGDALALLKTPSGQPFYFNFHMSPEDRDVTDDKFPGNTSVLGFTGVGKTTTVGFLLALSDKFNARLVGLDKDRGMEIMIRAMGGKYTAFKRGVPTGINPFQWEDNASNRKLCEQVVQQCVREKGKELTAKEQAEISHAVATVFALPFNLRRLGAVDQSLPNVGENSLRLRLRKWIGNERLGWVVDNARDTLDLTSNRKFGFDYTEFLDDDEVRPVVMLMLLHATQGLIDGTPFIYVMEEFWKPLMDEIFSDFALNKQKTIRKENGLGVFVTQSPSDVLKHPIGKTMVEQSVTVLFLPNPRADYDDYVNGFKVTPQEFEIIKNLPEEGRMFLVKQGSRSAIVKLDLGGMRDELIVLSGSIDNVELLDDIRAEVGDDPEVWLPILLRKVAERRAEAKRPKPTLAAVTA